METIKKKVVIVGDDLSGKTSIFWAYGHRPIPEVYVPTIVDNHFASIEIDGQIVELNVWDTAGKKEYDCLRPLTYPKADVILICFSIDNPESFRNTAEKWAPEVHHYADPGVPIILVGNKKDMRYDQDKLQELEDLNQKPIPPAEGHMMAARIKAFCYVECSATTGEGIVEVIRIAALVSTQEKEALKVAKCNCVIL